jgi:hypothetical protein
VGVALGARVRSVLVVDGFTFVGGYNKQTNIKNIQT